MAELAAGAVSSLLHIIRNEALLLDRVHGDVQFIKEEMESINSFLAHLTRTAPPDGEHDEQVRTWMKQVRELAHDCTTCIDLYLQRGNPAIHRAKGGLLWRYVWWAPWFVRKLLAQHRAVIQLSNLKDRARDVGERRLRYGVEVPTKKAASASLSPAHGHGSEMAALALSSHAAHAAAAQGEEEYEDGDHHAAMATVNDPVRRRAVEPRTLEDYCHEKLRKWLEECKSRKEGPLVPSIAIDASGREDAAAIASALLVDVVAEASFNPPVWINLPAVHFKFDMPLESWEIFCYILRELKLKSQPHTPEQGTDQHKQEDLRSQAMDEKLDVANEIREKVNTMHVDDSINAIKTKIDNVKSSTEEIQKRVKSQDSTTNKQAGHLPTLSTKPLGMLFLALLPPMPPGEKEKISWARSALNTLTSKEESIITIVADKLKDHVEAGKDKICLEKKQYVNMLHEVFPIQTSKPVQAPDQEKSSTKSTAAAMLGEDQIKKIVQKVLRDNQSVKHLEYDAIEETKKKLGEIGEKIKEQLILKGIVDKIKGHMEKDKRTLIILQDDEGFLSSWEETKNHLSLLGCACTAGAMVVIITKKSHAAKEFCDPPWEPITYSLVGLYHDSVLQLTSQQAKENKNHNSQIFHDILERCDPDEFCMKMFAHALYTKPSRSNYELHKLLNALVPQKSLDNNAIKANPDRSNDTTQLVLQQPLRNNAKKIFKFSYHDLPREYKSCLLYLAIFPQGDNIRRSSLEGRWIVEGLITKEDWPSAVHHAERCFDELIDRRLICPGDVSAAGKVKSCVIGDRVHEFITKTAKKQHILETRLSHHLAHHFSVFSNLRLRSSDKIETFVKSLPKFSLYLRLLKVLDLEGCQCFDKNHDYLKDICNKILLLKYLSLKKTNVTHLSTAINNLHELEVLDIRQTMVPAIDTKYVLILKLKRLLAGRVYSSPSGSSTGKALTNEDTLSPSAQVPRKIAKMENMEVMSNVNVPQYGNELEDIGRLWQLRKLGVVIDDNEVDLKNLLQVITNLNESLRSLSITLTGTRSKETHGEELYDISSCLEQHSKLLESLSINGVTHGIQLLQILAEDSGKLAKLTLTRTSMKQENLKDITKLPNLCCFRLQHEAYTDEEITFKENEFLNLKYLIIEGTNMVSIRFEQGAAPKLEKIVLSSSSIKYLHGITHLQNLKELELNGNEWLQLPFLAGAPHLSKVKLLGTLKDLSELKILAELPSLRSLMLLEQSCIGSSLSFNKGEFNKLNLLVVECSDITSISFMDGAAPKLEKIAWSFTTTMEFPFGISCLPQLKEVELSGDHVPDQVTQDIKAHKNKPVFRHRKKPQDQPKKQVGRQKKRKGLYSLASLRSTS